jgi:thioredoxin 1
MSSESIATISSSQYQQEVLESPVPVLLKMSTKWCPPCRALSPVVDIIARELSSKIKVIEIDGDDSPEISEQLRITGYPTMVFFYKGNELGRILGAVPRARILRFLQEHDLM